MTEDFFIGLPLIGPLWESIDQAYWGRADFLIRGVQITILVGLSALPLAMVLGIIGAMAKLSKSVAARFVAGAYTTIVRGTPEIVLILLVYYGVTQSIQDIYRDVTGREVLVNIDPFTAGTITLGAIYGAFMTEVFRGAFQSLDRGQAEAARAFGMSRLQCFWRIELPQVWRYAIPGISNVWMVLIKATALMSVVQLPELMRMTDLAQSAVRKPFPFFLTAAFIYLLITVVSLRVQQRAETWANRGVRRAN